MARQSFYKNFSLLREKKQQSYREAALELNTLESWYQIDVMSVVNDR